MFVEKIIDEIGRIKELVSSWGPTSEVSEIERELVLDKLKRLYEEIKFSDVGPHRTAAALSAAERISDKKSAVPESPAGEDASADAGDETNEVLLGLMGEKVDRISCPAPEVPAGEDASADAGDETNEVLLGLIGEKVDRVSCAGCDSASDAAADATPAEQRLFDDEPVRVSPGKKQIIMSLYGDDSAVPVTPRWRSEPDAGHDKASQGESGHIPHSHKPEPAQPAAAEPAVPSEPVAPVSEPVAPPAEIPEPKPVKKVLGEVIGGNGTAFNDRLGQQQPHHADIASRLQAQQTGDLRHAIGLNDRFLLMRDLFGGDSALYEETIARLDGFSDLDDALIYIQENFSWNPDSDGVRLIVDLLERKLG